MYAMVVKQLLLAAGANDPQIMAMIDRLMNGGLSSPSIEMLDARTVDFSQGAEIVRVLVTGGQGEKITLLLASEKPEKNGANL